MLTIVTTHLHSNLTSHSHFPTAGFAEPDTVLLLQASCMPWKQTSPPPHFYLRTKPPHWQDFDRTLAHQIISKAPPQTPNPPTLYAHNNAYHPLKHQPPRTELQKKTLRIPPFPPKKLIKWHYNILLSIIDAPTTCSSSPSTYWVFYSGNFHSLSEVTKTPLRVSTRSTIIVDPKPCSPLTPTQKSALPRNQRASPRSTTVTSQRKKKQLLTKLALYRTQSSSLVLNRKLLLPSPSRVVWGGRGLRSVCCDRHRNKSSAPSLSAIANPDLPHPQNSLPHFSENLKPYKLNFFAYKQNTAFHSPTTFCSKPNFEQHATAETTKTLFQKRPRVTTTTTTTTTNTLLNAYYESVPYCGSVPFVFFLIPFLLRKKMFC